MFNDLKFIDEPTEWAIWVIAISIAVIAFTFLWEPFYGYIHRIEVSVRTEREGRGLHMRILRDAVEIVTIARARLGGEASEHERAAFSSASRAAMAAIHQETGGGAVEPAHSPAPVPEPGVMHTLTIQGVNLEVRYDGQLVGGADSDHEEERNR